jgi:hypothetical protein
MNNAVAEREEPTTLAVERAARVPKPAATPSAMLAQAVASGASLEVVTQLMGLLKETRAEEQKMAFDAALSAAKAEIPVITKNRQVGYEHKDGKGETSYRHEDMGEIARTVDPILSKHGLSYRFRTTSEVGQPVSVTCIVAHRDGHAEENTLIAGRDDSGKKNAIQAIGSTITYLQRYTLKAALGLAASTDDDGQSSEQPDIDLISVEQRDELLKLIEDTSTDVALFCRYYKIDAVPDLPADKFASAKQRLVAKKGVAK